MHIYANNASSDYKAEASNFAAELALKDIQSIVSELNSLYSKISTIELFKETIERFINSVWDYVSVQDYENEKLVDFFDFLREPASLAAASLRMSSINPGWQFSALEWIENLVASSIDKVFIPKFYYDNSVNWASQPVAVRRAFSRSLRRKADVNSLSVLNAQGFNLLSLIVENSGNDKQFFVEKVKENNDLECILIQPDIEKCKDFTKDVIEKEMLGVHGYDADRIYNKITYDATTADIEQAFILDSDLQAFFMVYFESTFAVSNYRPYEHKVYTMKALRTVLAH